MSKPSSVSSSLLLESVVDFSQQSLAVIAHARRQIRILSHTLDPGVYDHPEMAEALSAFARQGRDARVQILVRDTDDLIERSHRLAALVRRLPSKLALRKLTLEPTNESMAFLLADTRALVYKNDDHHYAGFANNNAPAQVKSLREIFDACWEKAVEEPRLRVLHL